MNPQLIDAKGLDRQTELAVIAECVRKNVVSVRVLVQEFWPDVEIDTHQVDLIKHMVLGTHGTINEIAIKGCTGAGKGTAAAMGICIWFEICPVCKVAITSSSFDHAKNVMFAEVVKWRRKMAFAPQGEQYASEIKVNEQKRISVLNPSHPEGFSGFHGPFGLTVFDEGSKVPEVFFSMSKTHAKLRLAISNPRVLSGWFHRLFHAADDPDETQTVRMPEGGRRRLITVDGHNCRNVLKKKTIIPGQITHDRLRGIMAHPDPDFGRVFGCGKFPKEDRERMLVLGSWLKRHYKPWKAKLHRRWLVQAFGLDVADSEGGDATVLACGGEKGCYQLITRKKSGTMDTAKWVVDKARGVFGVDVRMGEHPICVDADGIGKGVADRLLELGCDVMFHHGSVSADDTTQYANYRAETYGRLANRLDPEGPWGHTPWIIPRDNDLIEELTAQEKVYSSDPFKFKLMPKRDPNGKEDLNKKLGRSPDKSDAVAYLYRAVETMMDSDRNLSCEGAIFAGPGGDEEDQFDEEQFDERKKKGVVDRYIQDLHDCADDRSWDYTE